MSERVDEGRTAPSPVPRRRGPRVVAAVAAALLCGLAVRDAWFADDAWFTLRSAWNLVHGFGLGWNADERVQAFTNPAWTLLIAAVHRLGASPWLAALVLSVVLTAATVVLVAAVPGARTGSVLLAVACLAGSRSFVDWSTSGLENPLLHAGTAAFAVALLGSPPDPGRRRLVVLGLLAALLATTRLDAALVPAPALAWLALSRPRRLGPLLVGALPLVAWLAFATLYFGSPLPNTALAKLNHGQPSEIVRAFGSYWLEASGRYDPVLLPAAGLALAAAAVAGARRDPRPALLVAGGAAYAAWIWVAGGDFMAGRLLTMPLVAAACAVATLPAPRRLPVGPALAAGVVAISLVSPLSPLRGGPEPAPRACPQGTGPDPWIEDRGVAYERGVYWPRTGLLRPRERGEPRDPAAAVDPLQPGRPAAELSEGGLSPYRDGPSVHHVEPYALGDGFLARLPGHPGQPFRPGHVERKLPAGYLDSLRTGRNLLADPAHRALWEDVRLATTGPLLRPGRGRAVLRLARRDLGALLGR